MAINEITQSELKELLDYDHNSGFFVWKNIPKNKHRANKIAGSKSKHGYVVIKIRGKYFKAHRLAWIYYYGVSPVPWVDHINRNRSDNRIENLRIASHSLNMRNKKISKANTSSVTGVSWAAQRQKWSVRIQVENKSVFLGWFEDFEAAVSARKEAEINLGFHLARPTKNKTLNRALWHLTQEFAKLKGHAIAA